MKRMTKEQLFNITICPVCKKERRQGEMMCGVAKPVCKYCYSSDNRRSNCE